jgi:RhoGAP (GTPase activating protein)-like protein
VDLLRSDEYWDPHAIAGLLKSFFRDLPTSILTRDLHMRFLSVMGTFHIPHICESALTFRSLYTIVYSLRPGGPPGKDH